MDFYPKHEQALVTLSLWLIEDERVGRESEEGWYFYLFTFVNKIINFCIM